MIDRPEPVEVPDVILDQAEEGELPLSQSRVVRPSDPDASLDRIVDQAIKAGDQIKIRLALTLFDSEARQYSAWKGQIWKYSVQDGDEARNFRAVMDRLFDILDVRGIPLGAVDVELDQVLTRLRQRASGHEEEMRDANPQPDQH